MEGTPKSKSKIRLSSNGSGENTAPDHSTPETSSRRVYENVAYDISPVHSPEWSEHLSQRVYWKWKSPDESARKCLIIKKDSSPKPQRKYTPPKPKRKIIRRNYSENISKWAEEFKSLQEDLKSSKAKAELEKQLAKEKLSEKDTDEAPVPLKDEVKYESINLNSSSSLAKAEEESQKDVLVVEITQGLTSLKSFPPDHQFPKVPKLDVENDMNKSDYTILMEDNSIEDEMIKFTQQIEEQIMGRQQIPQDEKCIKEISTSSSNSKVISAINKFNEYVKSPKCINSPSRSSKSPVIKSVSSRKKWASEESSLSKKQECEIVSWKSAVTETKNSESNEEELLFGDDSFDNIMLELVVETEKNSPTSEPNSIGGKENLPNGTTEICAKIEEISSKNSDSFGMLEDDSIIQPDVLNFLDEVESQAIAASQPLKCTPEEIQKKMIEAKKKLAVGKRKRRSEMAISITKPANNAKGLIESR